MNEGWLIIYSVGLAFLGMNESRELFFHNLVRTIPFEKREEVETWSDLRIISILPAWNMVIKKLAAPILESLSRGKLAMVQFVGKEMSDCRIAKFRLNYNSIKGGLKKHLLIDATAAFDNVIREIR